MSSLSLSDKAGFIGVGRFLRTVSKLLFALILVRLISKYDFGTYRQVFLLYNLLSAIFFLGVPTSIYYFLPQVDGEKSKTFIVQSEIFLFFLGILLGVFFLFFSGFLGRSFSNPSLPDYLRLFALYPLLDFPIQALPPILICHDKHKLSAIVNIIFMLTFLFALMVPLLLGCSLYRAFFVLILVSSLQLIVVAFYLFKLVGGFPVFFDFSIFINQIKYSVPLGLSGFTTLVSRELDKLIISFFFLPQIFAVYTIGARELPFVTMIPYAVSSTLFPKFVKLYKEDRIQELLDLWHNAIIKVSLLLLPAFVLFFVTAREVVEVLYTSNYLESVPVFRYYLLLILIHVTAFDSVILSLGFPKKVLYASLGAVVLNLILNVVFIQAFGFTGPAIATILVSYLVTIFFLKIIKENTSVGWGQVFPWEKYLKILIISILSGLISWPVHTLTLHPVLKILCVTIVFLGVYIFQLSFFKMATRRDVEFLKRWISFKVLFRS
ncbi:MAG TPA: hypothetical protein ENN17_00215 [bacterium]|nr:hypothetical protein [bacterium]